MSTKLKPPISFWIISILALIWNLMGISAYLSTALMDEATLAQLPEQEIELMNAMPSWVMGAFAVGVWFGALGSLFLLLRKALSQLFLMLSLLGVLVQESYVFFLSDTLEVKGSSAAIFPIIIIVISVFLYFYAKKAERKSWIA